MLCTVDVAQNLLGKLLGSGLLGKRDLASFSDKLKGALSKVRSY